MPGDLSHFVTTLVCVLLGIIRLGFRPISASQVCFPPHNQHPKRGLSRRPARARHPAARSATARRWRCSMLAAAENRLDGPPQVPMRHLLGGLTSSTRGASWCHLARKSTRDQFCGRRRLAQFVSSARSRAANSALVEPTGSVPSSRNHPAKASVRVAIIAPPSWALTTSPGSPCGPASPPQTSMPKPGTASVTFGMAGATAIHGG
jgi:hypothetical protein